MPEPRDRDRNDVILMPRQYAIVKDTTKGNLTVQVGPIKVTVSETDTLMAPDPKNPSRLMEAGNQGSAILPYVDVGESDYVVLSNPAVNGAPPLKPKTANDMVELQFGRQVNIPGPISFPLWPFQVVDVIKGHQLQTNQYLVVRVINDGEALANWGKSIVKTADGKEQTKGIPRPASLSIGQLIIIKGTEVSFYIPPTGLEVVKDTNGYVRDAITLEQLEYCVLVDQNGEKRFEQGPKVVFPMATEEFVVEEGHKKYKATELTPISGLHIKVTAPYKDGDKQYKVGDELFVTGTNTPIYYPRAEHALVKYGDRVKHYATAIPKGEGRYVMNRLTGEIKLERGPKMLLPDPRKEVIVRRILTDKQVDLWYPGNAEAMNINRTLATAARARGITSADYVTDEGSLDSVFGGLGDDHISGAYMRSASYAPTKFVGDSMSRKETYTPPRTVTLDTKYDGAVQIDVWTGYSVLVVDKNGNRQVVVGPQTILLEFDQQLASMEFSTGKPKTTDKLYKTSFLRVLNNQVSDIVDAMTSDDIPVKIKTSYRVNFLPEVKDKWFDAENYVKLLCDHVRSKLRNVVKKLGVQELADKHIDLVRDTVLGVSAAAEGQKKHRPGLTFLENGAHVYDVEVLSLELGDRTIAEQLQTAQRQTIQDALRLTASKRQLVLAEEQENITQKLEVIRASTMIQKVKLQKQVLAETTELAMAELARETETCKARQLVETQKQAIEDISAQSELDRSQLNIEQALMKQKEELALKLQEAAEDVKNLVEKTKAVTPDLIAALTRFSDMALAEKMADSMAPMALLGGKSVAEVLGKLLQGTGLEKLATGIALGSAPSLLSGNGANRMTAPVRP
jgi:major vault protein